MQLLLTYLSAIKLLATRHGEPHRHTVRTIWSHSLLCVAQQLFVGGCWTITSGLIDCLCRCRCVSLVRLLASTTPVQSCNVVQCLVWVQQTHFHMGIVLLLLLCCCCAVVVDTVWRNQHTVLGRQWWTMRRYHRFISRVVHLLLFSDTNKHTHTHDNKA